MTSVRNFTIIGADSLLMIRQPPSNFAILHPVTPLYGNQRNFPRLYYSKWIMYVSLFPPLCHINADELSASLSTLSCTSLIGSINTSNRWTAAATVRRPTPLRTCTCDGSSRSSPALTYSVLQMRQAVYAISQGLV